jgi:DNA repair exonuclease SbcCD ATPase subunit
MEVDPITASGGGIIDVASFALRLACLCLSKPPLRRVMVMDEPFKFVSEQYRARLVELLERLAKDMGVQFIMVTHIKELEIGKVIQL